VALVVMVMVEMLVVMAPVVVVPDLEINNQKE